LLNHGGNLEHAKASYPHVDEWLDLSTGISPWSWPVPSVPVEIWQRLPEQTTAFKTSVARYYGIDHLIPVAGSQVAIELIPQLLPQSRVAVPRWGYGEHGRSWQQAGHELFFYDDIDDLQQLVAVVEHIVVINPNNPTGELFNVELLCQLQQQISGYLLVDEAFMDYVEIVTNSDVSPSMLPSAGQESLIVLRSLGKYFGLAGARLGFVALPTELRSMFIERLTLWSISTPTLWLAERVLNDVQWQKQHSERIKNQQQQLLQLATQYLPDCRVSGGPLFVTVYGPVIIAKNIVDCFARHGVWLRLFIPRDDSDKTYFRIGLPDNILRIEQVLIAFNESEL